MSNVENRYYSNGSPIYSEIVKNLIPSSEESFKLGTIFSRLNRKFIALDRLCFGRENLEEQSYGVRLRSMGICRPVKNNEWSVDGHHIVELNNEWNLFVTPRPLHTYGLDSSDDRLIVLNHGTFFKSKDKPHQLEKIPVVSKPLFLNHMANNPSSHLHFMTKLIEGFSPLEVTNFEEYNVISYIRPTTKSKPLGMPLLNPNDQRAHWENVIDDVSPKSYGLPKFYLTHEDEETKELTCLDVVFAVNSFSNESRFILRRHHEDGSVDCLTLVRILTDGDGEKRHRPEWWSKLSDSEEKISFTVGLSDVISSNHLTENRIRSFDWHFLVRDTLRAFHILSEKMPDINTESFEKIRSSLSFHWPEPLRKFLMGGGKYRGGEHKRNTDALGGLFDELKELDSTEINDAVIESIMRWLWLEQE